MAKVWFVRRYGTEWIAPGGAPALQAALSELIFKLDLGPQRWLSSERPVPSPNLSREEPSRLTKVIVETEPSDLAAQPSTTYRVGFYDSPYPPAEAARRLRLT
ncbi:MAG TPA: hypothetical protein VL403_09160 [Candidatus Kryptonia bacterium]|nr:hypothetical protein [Candidatus Kryptonia bacterium]